jgi:tRNA threonylcarbamoyladenosine biosynthesis protein TsaE
MEAGRRLAGRLVPGSVLALSGDLGAGKTHFAKGVVEALGADPSGVTSPTFTLVHEYRGGRLPVFHFDFYRLDAASELQQIGWDDYLNEDGVLLVEWADRFPEVFPQGSIRVRFAIGEGNQRVLEIS